MPKLLLSVSDLRSLAGYAIRALRHPVATGQEAVATVRTIAGGLVSQPTRDVAPGPAGPSEPVAAEPAPAPTPKPPPSPESAPEEPTIRRTGPAPHVSRMPRDIERDVELELDDDA